MPGIRGGVYFIAWSLAGVCFTFGELCPFAGILVFLALPPAAWFADWLLLRRGHRGGGGLLALQCANFLVWLPGLLVGLILGPQFIPPIAAHNPPFARRLVKDVLGLDSQVAETWDSSDNTFVGRGAEYLQIRFRTGDRAVVEAALQKRCALSSQPQSIGTPDAWFMKWDRPAKPTATYDCAGWTTTFGASGDTLLFSLQATESASYQYHPALSSTVYIPKNTWPFISISLISNY